MSLDCSPVLFQSMLPLPLPAVAATFLVQEGEEEEEEASFEELKSITVRRHKLEAWVNEPFFEDTMPGCMVGGWVCAWAGGSVSPSFFKCMVGGWVGECVGRVHSWVGQGAPETRF